MNKASSIVVPTISQESIQYELFTQFLVNNDENISNTIEAWDSIPKYFFTPYLIKKLRTENGLANPYKRDYIHNKIKYTVEIHPASIEQKNSKTYLSFFPSVTEELIEEVLKKILSNQNYGIHDIKKNETWVKFTLQMIKKELREKGKTRSLDQIKHSIKVMSSCVLVFYEEGQEIWRGTILQNLISVNRSEYFEDPKKYHYARLPLLITSAINQLSYRQLNYHCLMTCKEQLARWLYKRLVNRYKQASVMDVYHIMFSTIKRDSGLLEQSTASDNRKKIASAIKELLYQNVLLTCEEKKVFVGRKIIDVKYIFTASNSFGGEQKAANKRVKIALQSGSFDSYLR